MRYTTYNTEDGVIKGRGTFSNPDDEPDPTETTGILLGAWGNPLTQRVDVNADPVALVPYTPPAPAPVVPASVTPWQIRRALNTTGLRSTVEAAVAASDQDVKDGWEFATEIRRDNVLLNAMASNLGMTPQQVDDLFFLASSFTQ